MKKKIYTLALAATLVTGANAAPLNVCNFEDYPIGTEWTMWQMDGNTISSVARVEADPKNSNNKVLHITLKDWGCHPEFALPTLSAFKHLLCPGSLVWFLMKPVSSGELVARKPEALQCLQRPEPQLRSVSLPSSSSDPKCFSATALVARNV